jgi:hypothetical protein
MQTALSGERSRVVSSGLWIMELPEQHGLYVWMLQGLLCCDACHGIKIEQSTDIIVIEYGMNSLNREVWTLNIMLDYNQSKSIAILVVMDYSIPLHKVQSLGVRTRVQVPHISSFNMCWQLVQILSAKYVTLIKITKIYVVY